MSAEGTHEFLEFADHRKGQALSNVFALEHHFQSEGGSMQPPILHQQQLHVVCVSVFVPVRIVHSAGGVAHVVATLDPSEVLMIYGQTCSAISPCK